MRAGITLILIAVALQALGPVSARSQDVPLAEQVQALETLFKVGLPETRGWKWVKAQLQDGNGGGILLPGDEAAGYTGNAWLVREEKNGTAELIILAAGWGFLTQRRKGAEDAELRSPGGPENVHLLGAPVEQRTFPPFLCALCTFAPLRFPSHRRIADHGSHPARPGATFRWSRFSRRISMPI